MEYNQEEAEKAMAKAEEKFKAKDVDGAKKFALKAKTLFPSLPGLPQAIAAYEVHIAGKKRKHGETNWCYSVLDADPSYKLEAIKQRYKKLCVQIHPDKNRSAAADGAFKLVKEAWDKISKSSAEAKSGGAKNPAGPEAGQGANTTTTKSNGPNAHRGTKTTNNNSTHRGPTNANGTSHACGAGPEAGQGANTTTNKSNGPNAHRGTKTTNNNSTHRGPTNANGTSHACGAGPEAGQGANTTTNKSNGPNAHRGNNAFGTPNTGHGCWYWEFTNADGYRFKSYHYYDDGTNTASTNASTGFGSINVLCPNCGRQAMNLDADGLAIRCNRCNMLAMRENKDGKFRIMLQLSGGNISVEGSNNVSVKILQANEVVIRGGENININKATAVTIKGGKNINIGHAKVHMSN